MRTILWYDLETFGLNPRYDRIAQAAAIRTDMDLNPIGEPIVLYAKLSQDYLPTPSSCLITGITPQEVNEKGICEAEFIKKLRAEFMMPGTIAAGYNSIGFDDEVIRNTLYRNLYDPYEREYRNGCSRWDIINLVRATRDLRPEGLVFTTLNEETGAPSFKLTDLTAENNIEQAVFWAPPSSGYAKGALRAPLTCYRLADKFSRSGIRSIFVSEKGNTHPLLPLFYEAEKSSALYCFDLTRDIPESAAGGYQETGIVRLMINRCPFVAPISVLDSESEKRLGFTKEEIRRKAAKAIVAPVLSRKSILEAREERTDIDTDPDLTIYQSFPSDHDKGVMESIRAMKPEDRLRKGEHLFDNDKYHKLLWRQVARNWPEALSEKDKASWKNFSALRLINPPAEGALSYEHYMRTVDELLQSLDTTGKEKEILMKLKEYGQKLYDEVIA